ncbi:hypothetical protein ACN38_g5556 [Penicillium nordicum]|uniref:Uncharacterized protein n=1 Tax=Penicillium nordicum TaxID=229535 RepID=A0A0M8P1F7_9EURO|nr:hypothetical protein ACN38_g5556 [Penicillium nordicum]
MWSTRAMAFCTKPNAKQTMWYDWVRATNYDLEHLNSSFFNYSLYNSDSIQTRFRFSLDSVQVQFRFSSVSSDHQSLL